MKTFYSFLSIAVLLCGSLKLIGQDTTYYDKELETDLLQIDEIIEYVDSLDLYYFKSYDERGNLSKTYYTTSKDSLLYQGLVTTYDTLGQVKRYENYKDRKNHGELISYWPNGNLKRKDLYEEGVRIEGDCYDAEGNTIDYYEFDIMPKFPGGDEALLKEIYSNLKYPKLAQQRGVQGHVVVQFIIDKTGKMTSPKVVRTPSSELSKATMKVIAKLMRTKWTPGQQDGENVKVMYTLPVGFKLQ